MPADPEIAAMHGRLAAASRPPPPPPPRPCNAADAARQSEACAARLAQEALGDLMAQAADLADAAAGLAELRSAPEGAREACRQLATDLRARIQRIELLPGSR